VFANRLGGGLDPTVRHTYGSLLVAGGVDLQVKAAMGNSRITTTERYLHARPATEEAARFTKAFGAMSATAVLDGA
jgi:integrase